MEHEEIKITIRLEDRDVESTLNPSLLKAFPSWFKSQNVKKLFFTSTEKKDPFPNFWSVVWDQNETPFSCPLPIVLRNLILLDEGLPTIDLNKCLGAFIDDLEAYNEIEAQSDSKVLLDLSDIRIDPDGQLKIWKDGEGYQPSGIFFGRETF